MQEMRVQFLGREDPVEEEKATHSRTLAWKIVWTKKLGRLQSMTSQKSQTQLSNCNNNNNNITPKCFTYSQGKEIIRGWGSLGSILEFCPLYFLSPSTSKVVEMLDENKAPAPYKPHPNHLIWGSLGQSMSWYIHVFLLMEQILKVYYEPGPVSSTGDPWWTRDIWSLPLSSRGKWIK